jgi:hypothetical protein
MNIRRLLMSGVLLICATTHAYASCPTATSLSSASFCDEFKAAAECNCQLKGIPKGRCTNMSLVYKLMIDTLGTLQRACEFQHETSTQECMDGWNCYRYGGYTSDGQLCNGTGHACS